MRICYVSSNQSIHDKRFIDKFIEQGYETHVVSFSKNKPMRNDGIKFYNVHLDSNLLKGLPTTRYVFFLRKLFRNKK